MPLEDDKEENKHEKCALELSDVLVEEKKKQSNFNPGNSATLT